MGIMSRHLMSKSAGLYPPISSGRMRSGARRASSPKRSKKRSAVRRKAKARPGRLIKGSAAAKAYMAKIRRKRRR